MANQASQSKWTGAMGVVLEKFPSMQRRERRLSTIPNAATAPTAVGMAIPTAVGTVTAKTLVNTNLVTQTVGVQYVTTSASAGLACGIRDTVASLWRGNAPGYGGFSVAMRFSPSNPAQITTGLMFVGLAALTTAIGVTVEPTAIVDCVGVGQVSTSNNLHFVFNKASGTGTKIDLGTDFPASGLRTAQFLVEIFCDVNDPNRAIHLSVTNEVNGAHTRIVIPGDHPTVPTIGTFMTYHFHSSNNAVALAGGIDVADLVIYTRI